MLIWYRDFIYCVIETQRVTNNIAVLITALHKTKLCPLVSFVQENQQLSTTPNLL